MMFLNSTVAAFPVDSGSIPCTHTVAHNHLNSSPRVLAPSSGLYVHSTIQSFDLHPSALELKVCDPAGHLDKAPKV